MRIHARAAAITLSIICLAGAQSVLAQQPEQAAASSPSGHQVSGDLIKVDDTAKTITVKAADGVETVLAFNDATIVAGARDVAGLATMTATKVDVTYTEDPTTRAKMATKIVVQRPAFMPAPAPAPSPEATAAAVAAALTLAGDLVIVNATDKTITVRGVDKVETILLYTDATSVTGAKDLGALSSMTNQRVIVTYSEDPVSKKKTITRIVITPQ
jgi:hypothetical protein